MTVSIGTKLVCNSTTFEVLHDDGKELYCVAVWDDAIKLRVQWKHCKMSGGVIWYREH